MSPSAKTKATPSSVVASSGARVVPMVGSAIHVARVGPTFEHARGQSGPQGLGPASPSSACSTRLAPTVEAVTTSAVGGGDLPKETSSVRCTTGSTSPTTREGGRRPGTARPYGAAHVLDDSPKGSATTLRALPSPAAIHVGETHHEVRRRFFAHGSIRVGSPTLSGDAP